MDWSITREFLWHIPSALNIAMYILFLGAMLVFAVSLKKTLQHLDIRTLVRGERNWPHLVSTLVWAGRVSRRPFVGLLHGAIFFGFMILCVATLVAGIHIDTPFKIFRGSVYILVSFWADLAGIAILVGLALASYRRYIRCDSELDNARPNREKIMYAVLVFLVVTGFLLEGIRILGTHALWAETFISPVGWTIAWALSHASVSEPHIATVYVWLWGIHMIATMLFIATLAQTKFIHIVLLPLAALVTPFRRAAVLRPMNFDDENAETFGLAKRSEATPKQTLDQLSCVDCGRCRLACPAVRAKKALDPKLVIAKLRDATSDDLWSDRLFSANELDACTTCGACMEECPASIEHVSLIMELRRYKALTLGEIPAKGITAITHIKNNSNPWGIALADRFQWANALDLPLIEEGKPVEVLLFLGCAGNIDPHIQRVVSDTVKLLRHANVSFALMGPNERCCGDPIRRMGDEYSFSEIATDLISRLRRYTFSTIVTICPHCMHTLGKEYALLDNGSFHVLHHSEYLATLVRDGRIPRGRSQTTPIAFHDPCYLGRHHAGYDAPRLLLRHAGAQLNELPLHRDRALCCGMGGGNMWYELPEGQHLAEARLDEIGKNSTVHLATACPYCMINLQSTKSTSTHTQDLDIRDVATLLAQGL